MRKKPEIIHRTLVAQSRLFKVEAIDIRFSNGVERTYERLVGGGNGAVMVVAMLDDERFVLIREYAGGIDDYCLTLPKGAIDMGETIAQAARRELQEEIGYNARELIYLKKLTLSPGYMSAGIHLVLARDLFPSKLEGDEPEPLETEVWQLSQWSELFARDDFAEGRSVAALALVKAYLAGEYQGSALD